ncbi:MAG: HD domain-containing phosphohydrolase [Sideroxyarcus sp.]|nr:HD domain-containing phosphohydrolase [Sideroxyarcus sp.]
MSVPFLKNAAEIVHCHHERYNGSGYPQGLRAEQIPILSRVFAVTDVFGALTSDRYYRRKLSYEEAKKEITKESGQFLDPLIVEVFFGFPPQNGTVLRARLLNALHISRAMNKKWKILFLDRR